MSLIAKLILSRYIDISETAAKSPLISATFLLITIHVQIIELTQVAIKNYQNYKSLQRQ